MDKENIKEMIASCQKAVQDLLDEIDRTEYKVNHEKLSVKELQFFSNKLEQLADDLKDANKNLESVLKDYDKAEKQETKAAKNK